MLISGPLINQSLADLRSDVDFKTVPAYLHNVAYSRLLIVGEEGWCLLLVLSLTRLYPQKVCAVRISTVANV